MVTVYLLWDQYSISMSFGDSRKLLLPPNMHKNSQHPEPHKSTGSQTAVNASVNLSTRALRNRKFHIKPNFAIFNVARKLQDIQTSLQVSQVFILVWGIWVAAWVMPGISSKTGDVFWHWSGYDIINPFDPWQLVTVRSDSVTNTAGLV